MKYLMMIFQDEKAAAQIPPDAMAASLQEFMKYNELLAKAGVLAGGAQLKSSNTATTIRVRNGKVALTDGPFMESREQLGGTYTFECATLDDALGWAQKCPAILQGWGTVEVRPILFNPMDAAAK